ncbi:MAG: acyltransferase, partial [Fibrobacterota bacterium]
MKYHEKIDGLRFVAIAFVLIEHFGPVLGHRITAGYYGVDLFFVISGFLITNILLDSKKSFLVSYKNFVGRRTLRIFPIYYLTLGFMLAIGYQPCRDSILYLATYTFNYAWVYHQIPPAALTHFWSLAVEEQFYLFWPVFILALRRFPKVLFVSILGIVALCFFQLTTSYWDAVTPYNYVGLFPRAGSLCLGALGAMMHRQKTILDEVFKNMLLEWVVFGALAISLVTTYE